MAKTYWIATYRSIKNPAAVEAYAAKTGPLIWASGGRILVRGTPAEVFEPGPTVRTVVIEFDSVAAATMTYNDPAYQDCVKVLGNAAVRDSASSKVPTKVEGPADASTVPAQSHPDFSSGSGARFAASVALSR